MAIHPDFPTSPHEILNPETRWFPADEALRESSYEKLLPPLVHKIRSEVRGWRDNSYAGATATSKALLNWWFMTEHVVEKPDGTLSNFRYYFAQREAIETVIYLYEVAAVKDKYDLIRYDSSGAVSTGMFGIARLKQWCEDINAHQQNRSFDFVFVDEEDFEKYKPGSFEQLAKNFRKYKEDE